MKIKLIQILSVLFSFCSLANDETTNIAILINKDKTPREVVHALEVACILHTTPNINCLFFDTQEVLSDPNNFRNQLQQCPIWVGPIHAHEAESLINSLVLPPEYFLSFSNNISLIQKGIFPMGPSPVLELAPIFRDIRQHCICRILVLIPSSWCSQVIPFFLKESLPANIMFFSYDQENFAHKKESLQQTLSNFSPDAIIAPFGDELSFEVLLEAIGLISAATGMSPYIAGTSLWRKEFHAETSLINAFKVRYPSSRKLLSLQKTFQEHFGQPMSNLALTAYDTLSVALELAQNPTQQTFDTCRGTITLTQPFQGYIL